MTDADMNVLCGNLHFKEKLRDEWDFKTAKMIIQGLIESGVRPQTLSETKSELMEVLYDYVDLEQLRYGHIRPRKLRDDQGRLCETVCTKGKCQSDRVHYLD